MTFAVLTTALDALRDVSAAVDDRQLDDPTPCSEWTVAQVLFHAAGDQRAWASVVGKAELPSYNPFDPPLRLEAGVQKTVAEAIDAAAAVWAGVDPEVSSVPTPLPPVPELAPALAAGACALDAAVHAWDVAVALGRPTPLTGALAEQLLAAAHATVEPLRGFAYAPALPAEPGNDAAATLLRYLGRDPRWTPPAR
ncbi:TIGR03086 family protein [Actinoplanes sp. LDG1-06]|uniref:TIGR03086 family protein n=1 Tax=Paractinoplanes ovalisporus TaxID=2810368 RepID=A0ABS2A677_9ACTN|nr:TIGR03086 family metal-binding protein [Actinoplanes ovalisporus]MBM2614736.1 TIGR03086 family protein [Actinoplanes ovalisporus]